ncbi:hypothetical protein D3C80_574240 [compost metagenome]
MQPAPIGALVQRNRNVFIQALGEGWCRRLGAVPMHGHGHQSGLGQARMGNATPAITLTRQQSRHHPDHTQPAGQPIGKRHAYEGRTGTMRRLLVQQTQARQDQCLVGNRIGQRMTLRPATDGGNDQARKVRRELLVRQSMDLRLRRREVVQQHIGAGQQILQPLAVSNVFQIERNAALAAVEHRKQCLVIPGRVVQWLDHHHFSASFTQL